MTVGIFLLQSIWLPVADGMPGSGYVYHFLERVTDDWEGTAVETPIGPVAYNISFVKNRNGHVTGIASLARSTHYWDFYPYHGQLHLKFLSTFAGNDVPIVFNSSHCSDQGIVLSSSYRDDVKIVLMPEQEKMLFTIFLDDKPHVKIRLTPYGK